MGRLFDRIDADIRSWLDRQHLFFVATAPLAADGCINLSPKGHDALRVIDDQTLAWFDYGGSGIETLAHLRENGRIVIMLCAFEGPPKIFRFHGRGTVFTPADDGFEALAAHFDFSELGVRTIVRVDVKRIADSCGFGVPLFGYEGQRRTSIDYMRRKSADEIRDYFERNNAASIDGLPAMSADEARSFRPPGDD
ncbi:MAG: pyridoxamine 5'-phosphate oxidase family protein [Pseudomonadota bacterium]